jgi:UDP-N-acetyl-D-mannosaminuronic acid transferase (WecB/TagA/CpsF family)
MNKFSRNYCKILGLYFYLGSARDAAIRAELGGLVVIPAAPALKNITLNQEYHKALLDADIVLPDSGFMVLIWNYLQHDSIRRVSGLAYLRELLRLHSVRLRNNTVWVLPNAQSLLSTRHWLRSQGIEVSSDHFYIAPQYRFGSNEPVDPALIERIERLRPQHVILAVGGGTQEPLGADLKHRLSYLPAIHCLGAAVAFLTGDQVYIPGWADRHYVGWLFRTLHNPRRFAGRYWEARKLFSLLRVYRDQSPLAAH